MLFIINYFRNYVRQLQKLFILLQRTHLYNFNKKLLQTKFIYSYNEYISLNINGDFKMKKILPIFIISILFISGIGTVAISENEQNLKYFTDKIIISEPFFEKNNDYLNVDFKESTSKLMIEGNPIIPKFSKVITLPFGTDIKNINVEINQKDYFLTSLW